MPDAKVADLYRVFPHVQGARPDEPGGALYVPAQGAGRLDNPQSYSVFYAGDSPAGAVAEAFGRFPEWTPRVFAGNPNLPGSIRAVAHLRLDEGEPVCDLDDAAMLLDVSLRPSEVVSRDYSRTRRWAQSIFDRKTWVGVRWWSFYDSRWASFGIWDVRKLRLAEVQPVYAGHPAVEAAARIIARRIVAR